MSAPTQLSQSANAPIMHWRANIPPTTQRPSTSSGETVEPKSELLRSALQDRRAAPQRAQSTTPRRARGGFRSQCYQDPWVPSDEEENTDKMSRSTGRLPPRRRQSDFAAAALRSTLTPSPPPSPTLGLGIREQESTIDKLKKENWDLKHRIALQQERSKKLELDLELALDKLRQSDSLFQKNAALEKENSRLKLNFAAAEEENEALNADMEQWHKEFVHELEQKDKEIQDRHLAIEEAAGWIQRLEIENQTLKQSLHQQQSNGNQADSDYFSGDQDSVSPPSAGTTKAPPLTPAADSDYFSADTSPNQTPKTSTHRAVSPPVEETRKSNARVSAMSFNRELGLRSITSKDSLFGNFLESIAPERTPARTLRRRCSKTNTTPMQESVAITNSVNHTLASWSSVRPLRDLYKAGDLGRKVDMPEVAVPPRPLSPSTASVLTRDMANDAESDIFSRGGTTRPSSPTTTINDGLSDIPESPSISVLMANAPPLFAHLDLPKSRVSTAQRTVATPAGFNYNHWPRKVPDWPPSASLHQRDSLFGGDGMDEMFAPSPPKRNPMRPSPLPIVTPGPSSSKPVTPSNVISDPSVPPRGSSLRVASGKHSPRQV